MNYAKLTDGEIVDHAGLNWEEFDEVQGAERTLECAFANGECTIVRRSYGYAILTMLPNPHIWLLWIDPEHRGRGLGKRFVRELKKHYGNEFFMTVNCHGADRRKFFGACGFAVTERHGELRQMIDKDFYAN